MDPTADGLPPLPSIRFQSLASGSSGNAYLLECGDDLVLIDCGIGVQQIQGALQAWGKSVRELTALILSHEHSDHVRSLASFLRYGTPVFATRGTANALGLTVGQFATLRYTETIALSGLSITPVRTSHDAAEPCGMLIQATGRAIALISDLGSVTDEVAMCAARCDLLVLESNHDATMLRNGPYPAHLKRRVGSNVGHLSNDQAGALVGEIATGATGPTEIWLAHLSATNNTPSIAKSSIRGRCLGGAVHPGITVLPRRTSGPVWNGGRLRPLQLQLPAEI